MTMTPAGAAPITRPMPRLVVLDTCVLLSNALRCLLLQMARNHWFEPAWSAVIGDEWQRNAARMWHAPASSLRIRWDGLQEEFPRASQAEVQRYKVGLMRSDRKDWHVIAAARCALANDPPGPAAVLTRNIRDFSRPELRRVGVALFDPDQFLALCLCRHPHAMLALLEKLPADVHAAGSDPESLESLLKRERLFRLNRLRATYAGVAPATSISH